jgi:adenosine deaminase
MFLFEPKLFILSILIVLTIRIGCAIFLNLRQFFISKKPTTMQSNKYNLNNVADLHVHLGSASTGHLLWEMANQRGIALREKNYWKFIDSVKIDHNIGFESYHSYFDLTQLIQSSPDAIEKSIHEAISLSYRKANIDLMEIRFNPMRRNADCTYDIDRILLSAYVGMTRAMMEYPIKAGLILEMDRRFTPKMNKIIVQKAIQHKSQGVVGVDVSGPNNDNFSFDDIFPLTDLAKSHGLGVTIHTGEAQPVEEVREVIDKIRPNRIGHGIRSIDDEDVIKKLLKHDICLEVCPTSNVTLSVVKDWEDMKNTIRKLTDSGVALTINSDGPVFLQTNALKECENLIEREILTRDEIANCQANSRKYTFVK